MEAFNNSPVVDLTTADGVKAYLFQTLFRATNVTPLVGGLGNFTYRVTLEKPFSDSSVSQDLLSTVVLKHAEPYSASDKTFPLLVERQVSNDRFLQSLLAQFIIYQGFEVLAYLEVPTIISPSTSVFLPKIYYEDRDNRVVIMYDCGEGGGGCITDYLKLHPVPLEVARRIGNSLGRFLGELHINSHDRRPAGSSGVLLKHKFADNIQARDISSFFFYGVVKRDLPKTTERYNEIIALVDNMHEKIKSTNEVLVMGDFWPGNILVYGKSMEKLSVVDWEASKPGLAGLDVGQFLAEIYTMQRFYPSSRLAANELISEFIASYKSIVSLETNVADLNEIAKIAAIHVGAQLFAITLMARPKWGSDEEIKELVSEGITFLLNAEDDKWRRESFLGELCS
ncbi:hypothetical protein Clacol_004687 [Clathrus columnatus]|uniref:Aminoglycoside phosphotransferase domain-containing protein n=1 Tax=Clathrus columnatus TaxID=1419009 RepID=A0AAV5AD92_9AGAM|nr:hypothetical protein Clacol_004687 [Clathrus columnatus]